MRGSGRTESDSMYLTVSKRFEFSASVRPNRADWSDRENLAYFGPGATSKYGYGNNYTAYFVFHGPVDRRTGMLVDLAIIKPRLLELLAQRYDHKFVNADTPPFDRIPPTPENLAVHLLKDASSLFSDITARAVACHLDATPAIGASAYTDSRVEREYWIDFSAARRTYSPHLSDAENAALFGVASSKMGHGHNYRLRVTVAGDFTPEEGQIISHESSSAALESLRAMLDHKNLNEEVPKLVGSPITTESLARFTFQQLTASLPVARVKLYEMPNFFAEYRFDRQSSLALELPLQAAHRLHCDQLTDRENRAIYGKCNNPAGHGHGYRIEATVGGMLDERTGTLFNLIDLQNRLSKSLEPWQYRHLDLEIADFSSTPSTGENICLALWPRLNDALQSRLARLRLWETPNNRFTLRKELPGAA
ncbi:hypothetical protein C3F09_07555 [candidate division GN15 bacterium]|uniref:6-carboxy-5,6,7,8-tetrahydropterin synthase n=1 Tax=candidate division GN15 bacterium TaxID=2072418 RepID=A0A855X350_9BACT|nr:MAG: hypothetical protein C3F09_07555 [candidate division GN15 bacterium]